MYLLLMSAHRWNLILDETARYLRHSLSTRRCVEQPMLLQNLLLYRRKLCNNREIRGEDAPEEFSASPRIRLYKCLYHWTKHDNKIAQ